MFEILFLGTSAAAPSTRRGLSASIVEHNEYQFLVDCGEGTQRQILKSRFRFSGQVRILLTHGDLDHILGLGGLISTLMYEEAISEINIFGGQSAITRVQKLLHGVVLRGNHSPMPLALCKIDPGTFFRSDDFSVTAFRVTHHGNNNLGYIFETKTRCSKDVLGSGQIGTKLVVVGDASRTDNILEFCRDADALVIESTYLNEEADMAKQRSHLTAKRAAELAKEAGVNRLILTHLSRRYRGYEALSEAQAIFPETVVAQDFDRFRIKRANNR